MFKNTGIGDEIAQRKRLKLKLKCFWHDRRGCEDNRCDNDGMFFEPANAIIELMDTYKLDGVDVAFMVLGVKSEWSVLEIKRKILNWKNSAYPANDISFLMND